MASSSLFPAEVLLYSTASSSSLVGSMALTNLAAPSSTSSLLSFKGTSDPAAHAIDYIPTSPNASLGGTGGLVFQLEKSKAILNVFCWQKEHPLHRIILPQKLSCLAVSPDAQFVAAACHDGRIFLWDISTGTLVSSFDAHYRSITVVRWSKDSRALVTASEDARILVWSVAGLLAPSQQSSSSITSSNRNPTPYCTLSDHNLAITDLFIGSGSFPNQMTLLSSSLDATVKMWDVRTRSLLTTFAFDQPISSIAMDPTERFFFASSANTAASGNKDLVYRVDLFRKKDVTSGHAASTSGNLGSFVTPALAGLESWEARGGGGQGEVERITEQDTSRISIGETITSMCLSQNATYLCVGTAAGNLKVIDVSNSQILKTVSLLGNAKASGSVGANAVTNLMALPKPRDLQGTWDLSGNTGANAAIPVRAVAPFGRQMVGEEQRGDHIATVRLTDQPDAESWVDPIFGTSELETPWPSQPATGYTPSQAPAQSTESLESLQKQIQALKAQLERAKNVNDEMWNTLVAERLGQK